MGICHDFEICFVLSFERLGLLSEENEERTHIVLRNVCMPKFVNFRQT